MGDRSSRRTRTKSLVERDPGMGSSATTTNPVAEDSRRTSVTSKVLSRMSKALFGRRTSSFKKNEETQGKAENEKSASPRQNESDRRRESLRVRNVLNSEVPQESEVGALHSWGKNDWLDLTDKDATARIRRRNITQVVVGHTCMFVITAAGEVYGAGENSEGQVSPSVEDERFLDGLTLIEEPIFMNKTIVQGAVGVAHAAFLTSDGYVITYGRNDYGQLGHSRDRGTFRVPPRIVQKMGRDVAIQVACSDFSTFILTSRGKVFSFGCGEGGILGLGDTSNQSEPKPIGGLLEGNAIRQMFAGPECCFAVSVTGTVYGWGSNAFGQLGVNSESSFEPMKVPIPLMVQSIACGQHHTLFLTVSGKVYGCGVCRNGQLGSLLDSRGTEPIKQPKAIKPFDGSTSSFTIEQVAAGTMHSSVLTSTGEIFAFGGTFSNGELEKLVSEDNTFPFRLFSSGSAVFGINVEKQDTSRARRFSLLNKSTSHHLIGMTTEQLIDKAEGVAKLAKDDKRRSLRHFQRDLGLQFDIHILNASFLKPYLGSQPTGDKIDFKRNSCIDIPLMVRGLEAYGNAVIACMGEQKGKEHLRHQIAFLATQLDGAARHASEPDQLRAYLIMMLLPFAHLVPQEYKILTVNLERLPKRSIDVLFSWIKFDLESEYLGTNLVKPLLRILDTSADHFNFDRQSQFVCKLLYFCFKVNGKRKKNTKLGFKPIDTMDFYSQRLAGLRDEDLSRLFDKWRKIKGARLTVKQQQDVFQQSSRVGKIDQQLFQLSKEFTLFDYPFLFSANAKHKVLQLEDRKHMLNTILWSQLFAHSTYFTLEVRRDHILDDTLTRLSSVDATNLKRPLRVKFTGEDGLDAGGVKKEFFQLLSAQLFSPQFGMFQEYESTNTLWFPNHANAVGFEGNEFRMVGTLIGLAIYNSTLLDVSFPLVMYRYLLGKMPEVVGLDELAELDPVYASNLNRMLDYEDDDFEDVFCAAFEITREVFGEKVTFPLKEGGSDISVTKENRDEYVSLLCSYILKDSIEKYMNHLREGFWQVIDKGLDSLTLFEPNELELATTGTPELDFDELEFVTVYDGGYTRDHITIRRFWKVAKSFTNAEKQQFMSFSTGSPKAPVGGLKTISFKIQRAGPDSERLVSSSTCFNTLLLPDYKSEEKLRAKLLASIEHNQGFGNE